MAESSTLVDMTRLIRPTTHKNAYGVETAKSALGTFLQYPLPDMSIVVIAGEVGANHR